VRLLFGPKGSRPLDWSFVQYRSRKRLFLKYLPNRLILLQTVLRALTACHASPPYSYPGHSACRAQIIISMPRRALVISLSPSVVSPVHRMLIVLCHYSRSTLSCELFALFKMLDHGLGTLDLALWHSSTAGQSSPTSPSFLSSR
jgi:hypothetical protein